MDAPGQFEIGEFSKDLECAICLEPWKDPVELQPCKHVFCRECVQRLDKCPDCRQGINSLAPPNRILVNMASEVQVQCKRCSWKGSRAASSTHRCDGNAAAPAMNQNSSNRSPQAQGWPPPGQSPPQPAGPTQCRPPYAQPQGFAPQRQQPPQGYPPYAQPQGFAPAAPQGAAYSAHPQQQAYPPFPQQQAYPPYPQQQAYPPYPQAQGYPPYAQGQFYPPYPQAQGYPPMQPNPPFPQGQSQGYPQQPAQGSRQEALKDKGNDAFRNRKYAEAIDWYTKAIDVDPNCEGAAALYSNRAASYSSMGHHDKAIEDAEKCILLRPDWVKGYFRKGTALEAMNRLDDCCKAFEDALKTEPNNGEVQENVNTLRAKVKERNEKVTPNACTTMEQAKTIGNSLFAHGKYDRASEFYGRAIALATQNNEDKANCYSNRAACRQQIHDFKGVIEDANSALAIDPNHVKALFRRGVAEEGLEKWQKALDDYNTVMRLSPGMSNVSQAITRCQRALRN